MMLNKQYLKIYSLALIISIFPACNLVTPKISQVAKTDDDVFSNPIREPKTISSSNLKQEDRVEDSKVDEEEV